MKKISNKDIEKLNACITRNNYPDSEPFAFTLDKALIKKAGYKVDTDKTKLEQAREYVCGCISHNVEIYCKNEDCLKKIELYEKAIEEIQIKRTCDTCKHNIYDGCDVTVGVCDEMHNKWELKK